MNLHSCSCNFKGNGKYLLTTAIFSAHFVRTIGSGLDLGAWCWFPELSAEIGSKNCMIFGQWIEYFTTYMAILNSRLVTIKLSYKSPKVLVAVVNGVRKCEWKFTDCSALFQLPNLINCRNFGFKPVLNLCFPMWSHWPFVFFFCLIKVARQVD